ncbi:MAG: ABC transporter ATP-binding protein [Promethearchaeota archaeon]
MKNNKDNNIQKRIVEFSPGKDHFEKARHKGSRSWIFSHLFYKSNKIFVITVLFTTILTSNLTSITSVLIGNAVNDLFFFGGSSLVYYTILILVLSIFSPGLRMISFAFREILAHRMERDCRREFYSNLLGKSQSFHEQIQIGELMALATNDVRMLNFLISPAISLIFESFTALVIPMIYIFLFYPFQLLLAPFVFAILFIISLRSYVKKIAPITWKLRGFFGSMNTTLNETLTGIEVVKATVQEAGELEKYVLNANGYRNAYIEQGKVQAKYVPFLILALTITFGLTHGIILNLTVGFSIGYVIGYLALLRQLRFPTQISIFVFAQVRVAITSAQRLINLMNRVTEIDENVNGISKPLEGRINFENVSFSYPGSDKLVLKNINLEIKSGQTVAIVGTTGSGKTTLTKLISRLYDVDSGQIFVDNIDVRNYSLKSLRSQISYIEQDVFLFSDSLFNNISFGRLSSIEEIIQIAKEAQAHDFIGELPEQYDSEVGERGVQLSGGERQRIAIARAFLSDPRILILDDSTSSIDSNTEDKIQRAIQNILKNRTTLLITHRLSQIRWADLIIVLKRGEIAAMGTHDDLLETSEEYRKIFIKKFDVDVEELIKQKGFS